MGIKWQNHSYSFIYCFSVCYQLMLYRNPIFTVSAFEGIYWTRFEKKHNILLLFFMTKLVHHPLFMAYLSSNTFSILPMPQQNEAISLLLAQTGTWGWLSTSYFCHWVGPTHTPCPPFHRTPLHTPSLHRYSIFRTGWPFCTWQEKNGHSVTIVIPSLFTQIFQ